MKIIRYDSEADVLVVKVKEGGLANEEILDNDIILGCDKSGKLVSVEVLDASKRSSQRLSGACKIEKNSQASSFQD